VTEDDDDEELEDEEDEDEEEEVDEDVVVEGVGEVVGRLVVRVGVTSVVGGNGSMVGTGLSIDHESGEW